MSNITNTKNDLIKGTSWSNPIQLDSDKGDKKNPGGRATILNNNNNNNNNNTANATSNSSQGSNNSHTVDHHAATAGRKNMGSGLDKEDEDESEDDEDKENRQWPKSHFTRSPAPEPEEQV
ncbi:hypothetical protein BG005_003006 [Podila minutissima]|nr:hypothetical protein BG005_003006 [Podila minutissima]